MFLRSYGSSVSVVSGLAAGGTHLRAKGTNDGDQKGRDAESNPKSTRARSAKSAKAAKRAKSIAKKLSQIEAAVAVLAKAGEPMNCKAIVEAMTAQGLWASPGGATPDATLYSSILRDLRKGKDARFKKKDRGHFTLADRK